jgi:hypothetical protein
VSECPDASAADKKSIFYLKVNEAIVLRITLLSRNALELSGNCLETALQELTNKSVEYRSHADPASCMIHLALLHFLKQATPSPMIARQRSRLMQGANQSFYSPRGILMCSPLLDVMHNEYSIRP